MSTYLQWSKAWVMAALLALAMALGLTVAPQAFADDPAGGSEQPAAATAFDYTGDSIAMIDKEGAAFGMLAVQEGSEAVYKDGKVAVTYIPKNTTIYNGFYLEASINDESWEGKTFVELKDGKFTFELDPSYCGKAWPIAPIKAKDGLTTGTQYYLAVPVAACVPAAFEYEGTEPVFIKADGEAFGMFRPQDGTIAMNNVDSIGITYYPNNKTVYAGFYLNASNANSASWDKDKFFAVDDEGNFKFDLDMSYSGKAWPIAPVKKKDGASTGDQYYLAIPSKDNLKVDLTGGTVSGIKSLTYTGKAQTVVPTVKDASGATLKAGTDYTVSGNKQTNVGTYTITVTGVGKYVGTLTAKFSIAKSASPMKLAAASKTFKVKQVKKAKKTVQIKANGAAGKVTYTLDKAAKKAKMKVSAKGKVTVKKGTKKGTYKITVKDAGGKNTKAGTKVFTIKIK